MLSYCRVWAGLGLHLAFFGLGQFGGGEQAPGTTAYDVEKSPCFSRPLHTLRMQAASAACAAYCPQAIVRTQQHT